MAERFCPFCGRANRSDLPRCMNCGQRMMPAVPQQDTGVNQGRSVLLQHDEDETQKVVSRTGNHEPWWRTPDGSPFGTIPPPPQVKEEMERFEAREKAKESVRRAEETAKEAALEHERKKAAAALARSAAAAARAQNAVPAPIVHATPQTAKAKKATNSAVTSAQLECLRCGTAPPPGGGFSFCLSCGGDLTGTAPKSVFTTTSASRSSAPVSHSAASPGVAGLRQLHETDKKTSTNTNLSVSLMQTSSVKAGSFPPGVAALLSFFVPGVGQIVNGQIAKGVVLLLASFFVTSVLSIPTVGLLPLIGRVVAALDAYRIADRRRKGQSVRPDEWDLG